MTIVHATSLDLSGARVDGVKRVPFEKGLFAGAGSVESPAIEASFDNLVGSFNAEVPKGSSVLMEAQAQIGGRWSGWYRLVEWTGGSGGTSLGPQEDSDGSVDVDTLKLKKEASAFRYRIRMRGSPTLSRVAVAFLDSPPAPPPPFEKGPWVREIELRPRSQMEEQEKYKHDICSPTSLSMVLERWGRSMTTVETAELVLDHGKEKQFGNWPLNVQAAATQGLAGQVSRLNGLADIQDEVARGRPVIVSVTIRKGDLSATPKRSTKGHILVAAGFTPSGDVIAYDPAAADRKGVRRVYPRKEFERIWLQRKLGLAYVLGPRFPQTMFAGAASADLFRKPKDSPSSGPMDPDRVSQLTSGQEVIVFEAKGDWVRVEVADQPYWNGKGWQGYPGWMRADALTMAPGKKTEPARSASAPKILETAEGFIGLPYIWGGLSLPGLGRGVDCSGLVYASYRSQGITLARDARDQYRRAAKIPPAKLRPGDLVFLKRPDPSAEIYHVMLYAGGEAIIESRDKDGVVKTTFHDRFGRPLSDLKAGDLVPNLPGRKPAKVRIDFGSLLHP